MIALAILGGLAAAGVGVTVLLSRWPVGEEAKAVAELIDHDGDDWEDKGSRFTNKKAGLTVRQWREWSYEAGGHRWRMEITGAIQRTWKQLTWAERRVLWAAMRRWERKRIQGVVIKALED